MGHWTGYWTVPAAAIVLILLLLVGTRAFWWWVDRKYWRDHDRDKK